MMLETTILLSGCLPVRVSPVQVKVSVLSLLPAPEMEILVVLVTTVSIHFGLMNTIVHQSYNNQIYVGEETNRERKKLKNLKKSEEKND